jgi:outer membrane protein assembly factor BamB
VIYLGASGGKFLTFNTKTKRSIWQVNLKGYSFDYASPLVYGGIVYFSGYKNQSIDSSARPAGVFYAVDAVTGKELWTVKVKGRPTSAALDEGIVCFGDQEKNLIALDSRTGEEKWRFKAGDDIVVPAILNGTVYFCDADGVIYAVDLKTGQQKWKGKKLPKAGTTLALDKSTAYFGGESHSLFAVDLATGEQKWSFKTSKPCRTPVLTDKTIYSGCEDKVIYALDTATGAARWEFKTSSPVVSLPIVSDSAFYFLDAAAYLHALR